MHPVLEAIQKSIQKGKPAFVVGRSFPGEKNPFVLAVGAGRAAMLDTKEIVHGPYAVLLSMTREHIERLRDECTKLLEADDKLKS